MEAPEKIYCIATEGGVYLTTFKPEPPFTKGIEYIRTDIFIDKVCEWIEDNIYDYLYINRDFNEADYKNELIEGLRKAMEE